MHGTYAEDGHGQRRVRAPQGGKFSDLIVRQSATR